MKKKIVSGIMVTLLLISMLTLVFNIQPVKAQFGTIYIRADGSIDPDTAPISTFDNVTYTLTDNIVGAIPMYSNAIVVERDDIVVDGAGYILQGTGAYKSLGIELSGRSNVTIKNMEIRAFDSGIHLSYSSKNNTMSGNNITNNDYGIKLWGSSNNSISRNDLTENRYGTVLDYSSNYNSISGNNITNNHDGIHFLGSSNTSIAENDITDNSLGVLLVDSSGNSIARNNVTNNRLVGVELEYSSNNSVTGNNVVNTYDGNGIKLLNSSSNNISGNNIRDNWRGVALFWSSDNNFYHNNFINNTQQVYDNSWEHSYLPPSINVWDNGYPSGGNYWSDYAEKYQDARGLDGSGIWNTPYVIDDNNQDNYPLMSPTWSPKLPSEEVPFWMQWWFWTIVTAGIVVLAGIVYFLKKRKPPTPTASLPPPEGALQNIHNAYNCHSHLQTKTTQNTNPLNSYLSFFTIST